MDNEKDIAAALQGPFGWAFVAAAVETPDGFKDINLKNAPVYLADGLPLRLSYQFSLQQGTPTVKASVLFRDGTYMTELQADVSMYRVEMGLFVAAIQSLSIWAGAATPYLTRG